MKTLYITDLDGTLLNSKAELSAYSADIIKKLISEGANFSVATARTKATVLDMFEGIGLKLPIGLMNGVMVFDPLNRNNVICHAIDKKIAEQILEIYKKHNKHPMLYMNKGDYIEIHHSEIDNIHQLNYINDRNTRKLKKFLKVKEYNLDTDDELLYIVSFDKPSELEDIYREISVLDGVISAFYSDNYTECNFLETMNGQINKGTAALEIKKLSGADRLIAFGDNLNDIPLFEVSDESYAVSNAHEDLKAIATGVIESNDNDGVARFIYEHFNAER